MTAEQLAALITAYFEAADALAAIRARDTSSSIGWAAPDTVTVQAAQRAAHAETALRAAVAG